MQKKIRRIHYTSLNTVSNILLKYDLTRWMILFVFSKEVVCRYLVGHVNTIHFLFIYTYIWFKCRISYSQLVSITFKKIFLYYVPKKK